MAVLGSDTFGMKLHPVDRQLPVRDPLDDAIVALGRNYQAVGQAVRIEGQGMIARGHKVSGNAVEQRRLLVLDLTDFAVHWFWCQNDLRSESLSDALVAETNTEDWQCASRLFDQVEANSSFVGIAGSW